MTQRILVVEDQEDLRGVLRTLLTGSGYEMIEAADGQAGVEKAKSDRPDLILMDTDRTPATTMRANQLRLWFASYAYVLMCALRRIALAGTELAKATCASIRLKLLKIGAQVTVSVRRVKFALASAHPFRDLFAAASTRLRQPAA